MKCEEIERKQVIERYLTEQLDPAQEQAFEKHYLGCAKCFEELQLRHAAALVVAETEGSVQTRANGLRASLWRSKGVRWALAAAALILILIIPLSYFNWKEQPALEQQATTSAALLRTLGNVEEAPLYLAVTIRGESINKASLIFEEAMDIYVQGNYESAVPLLERVRALDPKKHPAAFYLGISSLMLDRAADAARQLSSGDLLGDSAYEEEARWYLAKAYFQQGRLQAGRAELRMVVSLDGVFKEDAERNLRLLEDELGAQ